MTSSVSLPAQRHPVLDPLPTAVLKEFLPELLPFLTDLCNASLTEGSLPVTQRHAIVFPRVKKAGADPADVCNYRPISNLTFMSNVVERLVCRQWPFLTVTGYYQTFSRPTGRNTVPGTETAVLKIVSDILRAAESGKVTLLGLLDMSAAYRGPQYID